MATDFSSFRSITNAISALFKLPAPPAPPVPAPLILLSTRRSGLSATRIAKNIIARQEEAGIPAGALPSGDVNPNEIMEQIRVEEILKELIENMRISITIPPGLPVISTGANGGGPIVTQGVTITFAKGLGVVQ